MEELLALIEPEPWGRFTAVLIAAMAFSRGLDFLSRVFIQTQDRHAQAGA